MLHHKIISTVYKYIVLNLPGSGTPHGTGIRGLQPARGVVRRVPVQWRDASQARQGGAARARALGPLAAPAAVHGAVLRPPRAVHTIDRCADVARLGAVVAALPAQLLL